MIRRDAREPPKSGKRSDLRTDDISQLIFFFGESCRTVGIVRLEGFALPVEEASVHLREVVEPRVRRDGVGSDLAFGQPVLVPGRGDVDLGVGSKGGFAALFLTACRVVSDKKYRRSIARQEGELTFIISTNQCNMASMLGQLCAEPTACR